MAEIVEALGLTAPVRLIVNSAQVGYEKPHPEIFRQALAALDHPRTVWMVGDSLAADIGGAQGVGIKPILVRKRDTSVPYNALPLQGILSIVEAESVKQSRPTAVVIFFCIFRSSKDWGT